jgi:hypothetical protein
MNSVLIGVDFTLNGDDVSFLEMNTDVGISSPMVEYFDFTSLFNYITTNNFTKLHLIYKEFYTAYDFIDTIKTYCTNNNITYNETITELTAILIPDVESDNETLVIRLSFNSQAILDDLYCRDKSELMKLMFDDELTQYIPKTYSKYNDDLTISDNLNILNDNGINPNLIVKRTMPDGQKNQYPAFYKLSTEEELQTLKNNLGEGTLLQEYVYNTENIIDSTIVNHVRSWFLISNGLSDIIDCGAYVGANSVQIEENLITYTDNKLDNIARSMFFSNPSQGNLNGVPSTYLVNVQQSDNTFENISIANLQIGDVVEAASISTLDTEFSRTQTERWVYTGSLNELITYTTASVMNINNLNVSAWFHRIDYTNGSSLLPNSKLVLVENSGSVSFKNISELEIGNTIFNSATEFSQITEISREYYSGSMTVLDIEPTDVFIAGTDTNEIMHNSIIVHNKQT